MNDIIKNSNLEFRKIKSLNFLYEVNSNGTIFRNVKSKKQYKIKLDMHHSNTGYYCTFIKIGTITKRIMMHVVVAECWLGNKPDGYEIDHIDRNSRNNDYRNLRYVTKSQQMENRDHTNIAVKGSINLQNARMLRAKSVILHSNITEEDYYFESYAECARMLAFRYNKTFEAMRNKLKSHRSNIYDFNVKYLS